MPKHVTNFKMSQRRKHEPQKLTTMFSLLILLLSVVTAPIEAATQHQVQIFSNSSTVLGQMVTSSTLVWESYDAKDARQLQYAVQGGKWFTHDEHYPIYVCRVYIDGLYISGHTEKIMQAQVCVNGHNRYDHFDFLVNKGHLGRIAWKYWNKYNAGTPVGAIRFSDENVFIARHRNVQDQQQAQSMGADYNLGRFDPVGFGKIKVVEQGNEEKYYDEGEVLVETQPFRYELRDIKLDKLRTDMRDNITELASSVLQNTGDQYSVVETVMSYEFDHIQNWGSHEGTARGLPTKIYESDAATPAEVYWGLKHVEKRYETKSVHTKLWPGTALNITLKGNYVTLEAPYSAKLYAFYYGVDDSVSRKIYAELTKHYLKDVKLEFGQVYFIENGTVVPTTTTTSTSTTSTTTHATTTTGQPKPISEPPVVHLNNIGDQFSGPDALEKSLHDSPSHNEISRDVPENLSEQHQKHALAGVAAASTGSRLVRQLWLSCTTAALLCLSVMLII